jgi:hypothetical protein
MPATRHGDIGPARPAGPATRTGKADTAPRHYVVFRATTSADGATTRLYEIPGVTRLGAPTLLDEPSFGAWLRDNAPTESERGLIAVLVIQQTLDARGSIVTCCLERRRGSATGPFHGRPARVTFAGAIDQVRFYRTAAHGRLREMAPSLTSPPLTRSRSRPDHLAGEERVIRRLFGATAQVLDMRSPTVLEDLVGLSAIVHLRAHDEEEIDCGIGWHGTTPFVLRADFPRFGAAPALPPADTAAAGMAAAAAGLITFETRADEHGAAVLARARLDGALYLIRPGAGGTEVTRYTPGVPDALPSADQALWLRYAGEHELLTIIDGYRDGGSDNIFVVAGGPDGHVTRHLIDVDGIEVWRAAADDTAVGTWHRERMIGPRDD